MHESNGGIRSTVNTTTVALSTIGAVTGLVLLAAAAVMMNKKRVEWTHSRYGALPQGRNLQRAVHRAEAKVISGIEKVAPGLVPATVERVAAMSASAGTREVLDALEHAAASAVAGEASAEHDDAVGAVPAALHGANSAQLGTGGVARSSAGGGPDGSATAASEHAQYACERDSSPHAPLDDRERESSRFSAFARSYAASRTGPGSSVLSSRLYGPLNRYRAADNNSHVHHDGLMKRSVMYAAGTTGHDDDDDAGELEQAELSADLGLEG